MAIEIIVTSKNRQAVRQLLSALPDASPSGIARMTLKELAEELEGAIDEKVTTEDAVRAALATDSTPPATAPQSPPPATPAAPMPPAPASAPAAVAAAGGDDVAATIAMLRKLLVGAVDESQVRKIALETMQSIPATPAMDAQLVADMIDKALKDVKAEPVYKGIAITIGESAPITVDGPTHPMLPDVVRAIGCKVAGRHINVWLAGPAGSGKSTLAKQAAKALGKRVLYTGAVSSKYDLIGFLPATGATESASLRTPLRDAYEHGGLFVWDDIDGSDPRALVSFLGLLDGHDGFHFPDKYVERHPDFACVATANTWGTGATAEYVGRAKLDGAFLGRFPARFMIDYNGPMEAQLSGTESAAFAGKVRAALASLGIKHAVTPRHSMALAALIASGMARKDAEGATIYAGLTADQTSQVRGIVGGGK